MHVIDEFKKRGFVDTFTNEEGLYQYLSSPQSCYIGFDPTASSLHVGSLVPIMSLAHMQRAGHRPIALVGGGTGMIGDPSGKTEMRNMLTVEAVEFNKNGIKNQLSKFIDFGDDKAKMVDNADWLLDLKYIDFLRDVGRFFSINRMIKMESYKSRFESETGLSFIEFNYTIMQAYDFKVLSEVEECFLQMGGSDQWGNIIAGVDLVRRTRQKEAFGLTFPLITNSSGTKMGKTEKGTVWLDAEKTSPYDYYQFWINTEDNDVSKFLSLFTFLPVEEIEEVSKLEGSDLNSAKSILAFEATKLAHGEDNAVKAYEASTALFGAREIPENLLPSSKVFRKSVAAKGESVPSSVFEKARFGKGFGVLDLFKEAGLCKSTSEARRLVQQGGCYINENRVESSDYFVTEADFEADELVLRAGKKRYHKIILK
ncbi:MAG: tyrosine--tRNA ligase [Desulforegulaceae bacterium]|nr:tyrosine--tRNA ligase [Desulforegulaceae bacterium]